MEVAFKKIKTKRIKNYKQALEMQTTILECQMEVLLKKNLFAR